MERNSGLKKWNTSWRYEVDSDLRSNEHYLSSSEKKAWKNSGLYGIWTHDLCDTGSNPGLNFFQAFFSLLLK